MRMGNKDNKLHTMKAGQLHKMHIRYLMQTAHKFDFKITKQPT